MKDYKAIHRVVCHSLSNIAQTASVGALAAVAAVAHSASAQLNKFGLEILSGLFAEKKTIVISPLSIAIALSMLADAASGQTRDEIRHQLGPAASIILAVNTTRSLMPPGAGAIANSLWTNGDAAAVCVAYLATKYGASVDRITGATQINDWAMKNTDGMIPQIVTEKDVAGAQTILVNALWFSCLWVDQFNPKDTNERATFTHLDGSTKTCALMYRSSKDIAYVDSVPGFVSARLPLSKTRMSGNSTSGPHEASRLEIVIIVGNTLPDTATVSNILSVTPSRGDKVVILLPRTKCTLPPTSIKNVLVVLGINACFEERVELVPLGNKKTVVSDVLHATQFEFDERGAKGAAVTAVVTKEALAMEEKRVYVECNRPFFVGVVDNVTGILVLAGYVTEPSK